MKPERDPFELTEEARARMWEAWMASRGPRPKVITSPEFGILRGEVENGESPRP